jgi:glucose-6-phosphate 1-epimerase
MLASRQMNELPKITLSAPDGATAEIYLHGAHVTSWKPANDVERLFVSKTAAFRDGFPIRGGVPVIFPQFGGLGPLAKHGFARLISWEATNVTADSASFQLTDSEATRALWPHAFRAELKVSIGGKKLEMQLSITNTGAESFSFTSALHTYLSIHELASTTVEGLQGLQYLNVVKGEKLLDAEPKVVFEGDIDRSYYKAGSRILRLVESDRVTTVSAQGFPDAVVWNPGEITGSKIGDLEPDGYLRFVCIEAAAIEHPIVLSAGETWLGVQILDA